ncbi:putative MFS allantoate transporter [Aspergillus karnatakaensis]|uniref:putative MFS allantoate transporter n=1 Tax=Aspergillus karnatakaensis TaxID=1810916 RepID=UPI003CCD9BD8
MEKVTTAPRTDDSETGDIVKYHEGEDEALKYIHTIPVSYTDEDEQRVRRKIDFYMLPWMCGLYLLQYLDKTALSYASSMGIRTDNSMSADDYSLSGSIFYIGYLVFEYPHNRLMQKFPLGKYISVSVIIWGAILSASAGTHNAAGVLAARFFLGGLEGAVTAGFVLITAQWYPLKDQALRSAIWFCFNGMAQIVGGVLAYGVSRGFEEAGYTFAPWKAIFLITGLITAVYGMLMLYFMADSPVTARWLSEEEKSIAIDRLRGNQQGIGSKVFKWNQFREAFTDVRTYLIFLFMVTACIPCGGITVFFTQLIESFGFDSQTTFLLAMPGGFVQIVGMLSLAWLARKINNRMFCAVIGQCLGLLGISLMMGLSRSGVTASPVGQLIGYYLMIGNSATALLFVLSSISSNTAGHTKKTTVNAIALIGYCVGFLIGPQTYRAAPAYWDAKWTVVGTWSVALGACLALYEVNRRENQRREGLGLPEQPEGQEFGDLTDKENLYFRYSL